MDTYALNVRLAYNHQVEQGQRDLILLRGRLLQCTLNELNTIQDKFTGWSSAYGQCITNSTVETSTTSSSSSAA